jgi:hypothetical protein
VRWHDGDKACIVVGAILLLGLCIQRRQKLHFALRGPFTRWGRIDDRAALAWLFPEGFKGLVEQG